MVERNNDFITGLLIGGLAGALIGILYAPKSGRETRDDIGRKTDELMVRAKDEYDQALEKSRKAYEKAVKAIGEMREKAEEKVGEVEKTAAELKERGKESLEEGAGRFKRAVGAGLEAYRHEKETPAE